MLDQKRIKELFEYDPLTGNLIKRTRLSRTPIRSPQVVIDGKFYRTTTIIWLYMTGEHQPYIMRVNKNPTDNKWRNLRLAKQEPTIMIDAPTPELDDLIGSLLRTTPIEE